MTLICSKCRKANPDHANFCYFDGTNLKGTQPVPTPLPPGSAESPWLVLSGVAALAGMLVLVSGLVSLPLAIGIAALCGILVGWQQYQARRTSVVRASWWRLDEQPHPKMLCGSIGTVLGLCLLIGVNVSKSPPTLFPVTEPPPVNDVASQAGQPSLAEVAASPEPDVAQRPVVQQMIDNVQLARDTPVRSFLISAPSTVSSNVQPDSVDGGAADRAMDGNNETYWTAVSEQVPAWLRVEFDRSYEVDGVALLNGAAGHTRIRRARLVFQDDSQQIVTLSDTDQWQIVAINPVRTSSVRLEPIDTYGAAGTSPGRITELWYCHRNGLGRPGADWRGDWEMQSTDGEQLRLRQEGDWVTGTYSGIGRILGRSTDQGLLASWYYDAQSGELNLQMSADGKSIQGKWNSGPETSWYEDKTWSCKRL